VSFKNKEDRDNYIETFQESIKNDGRKKQIRKCMEFNKR